MRRETLGCARAGLLLCGYHGLLTRLWRQWGQHAIAFTSLITLQFLIVLLHDLVEVPGWSHPSQMAAVLGKRKLYLATLANSTLPGLAVAFALYFSNRPKPAFVHRYWTGYCAFTVVAALAMWYLPYFLGGDREDEERVWEVLCRDAPDSSRAG